MTIINYNRLNQCNTVCENLLELSFDRNMRVVINDRKIMKEFYLTVNKDERITPESYSVKAAGINNVYIGGHYPVYVEFVEINRD